MSNCTTFTTLFDSRVRDAVTRFTQAQKDSAVEQAVKRYASIRPREQAQDYSGDGTTFDFALPTDWVVDLSVVRAIEYPQGARVPVYLERGDWIIYRTPTGLVLRLVGVTPAAGETMRVLYSGPHIVDFVQSTVSVQDEGALADLAASIGFRDLAAVYANTVDSTIEADSVDARTNANEYAKLADSLESRCWRHMGVDKDAVVEAASSFIDVDQLSSLGRDKLTHPNRGR